MPFTPLKGLSVQAAGSNAGTWGAGNPGNDLNTGVMGILDNNLAGLLSLSTTSGTVLLSSTQVQNCMIRYTGALVGNVVISPDAGVTTMLGFYCFENLTTNAFTVTVTTGTGSVVLPQSRRGIMFIDGTNAPRIVAIVGSGSADPIPVGTVMLFYQTAAPTGWTISSSLNDYALKLVSATGGVTSGSVNYSTLFGRTATDSTTLTTNQIPAHTHDQDDGTAYFTLPSTSSTTLTPGPATLYADTARATGSTGGGAGHTHPLDMRVKTAAVILASKN